VLTGASSVAVTRYRYRGSTIPTVDPRTGSSRPRQLTSGQDTWSARCAETRTSGAASGPGKRAGRKASTAPRSDSTGAERRDGGFAAVFSLEPAFRAGHGMVYQALAGGRIDEEALRDLLVAWRAAARPRISAVLVSYGGSLQ
jgi:hypothetical protein